MLIAIVLEISLFFVHLRSLTLDVSRLEVTEDGGAVEANVTKIELDDCKLPERFAFAYAYCGKQKVLYGTVLRMHDMALYSRTNSDYFAVHFFFGKH